MKETRESLIEKIRIKTIEVNELEIKCQAYWDLTGVTTASSSVKSESAYAEAQRLSRLITSRRKTIMKMYDKLSKM